MAEYVILGNTLEFTELQEKIVELHNALAKQERQMTKKFLQFYEESMAMSLVLDGYKDFAQTAVNDCAKEVVNELRKYDVFDMVVEDVLNQFDVDTSGIDNANEEIYNRYESFVNEFNQSEAERAQAKENRTTYEGYGYSVGSQMSASMKAGAINTLTGSAYGIKNAIGSSIDKSRMSKGIEGLYNSYDTKMILCQAILDVMEQIYAGLTDFVMKITQKDKEDFDKASFNITKSIGLLDSAKEISEKRVELLLQAIKENPFNTDIYTYILDTYGDKELMVEKMMNHFVPEDIDCQAYKKVRIEKMISEAELIDVEECYKEKDKVIKYSDFLGFKAEEYIKILDDIIQLYDKTLCFVDGNNLGTVENAKVAREEVEKFYEMTNEFQSTDETKMLEIKNLVESFKQAPKDKYLEFINDKLTQYDLAVRTANGIKYDTREEAQQARKDIETLVELWNSKDIHSVEDADILGQKINATTELKCKEEYLNAIEVIKNDIMTANEMCNSSLIAPYDKRDEESKNVGVALCLLERMQVYGVQLDQFKELVQSKLDKMCVINNVKYDTLFDADKHYYKVLSKAISYQNYLNSQATAKKSFFGSIANGVKGTIQKLNVDAYNYFTSNGTKSLPNDTEEDGAVLCVMEVDTQKEIQKIRTELKASVESLSISNTQITAQTLSSSSIRVKDRNLNRTYVKVYIQDKYNKINHQLADERKSTGLDIITKDDYVFNMFDEKFLELLKVKGDTILGGLENIPLTNEEEQEVNKLIAVTDNDTESARILFITEKLHNITKEI